MVLWSEKRVHEIGSRGSRAKKLCKAAGSRRKRAVAAVAALALALVGSTAAYAATAQNGDAGVSPQALQDYTVSGVSPRGTTINLFDYWITTQDASDTSNPSDYQDLGVNSGHVLKFGSGMGNGSPDSALNKDTVNEWTQSSEPRTGIVADSLGSDGYPVLSDSLDSQSLSYLFNSTSTTYKNAYTDVDGLLQVDSDGYYYYDSKQNFAEFTADGNGSGSFTLYDEWGVASGGNSPDGQFFPFNAASEVFTESHGQLEQSDIDSSDAAINHYFGLSMSTRFVQQYGGHVDAEETKDVTYNFSGDDDVWIYIDGTLVGDLGGIHDASSIQINFATGAVIVYDDNNDNNQYDNQYDNRETVYQQTTLGALLGLDGDTFDDNTYHTLDFFYLERGNVDSNMSLKYNLVNIPESGVVKVDQSGNTLEGVSYELYPATVDADGNYVANDDVYYTGTTDANGEMTFTTTEGSGDGSPIPVSLDQLAKVSKYWILRESGVPDGYRDPGDIWLRFEGGLLLSSNPWDTGTYAQAQVTVTAADTLYARNDNGTQGAVVQTSDQGFIFAVVMQKQDDGSWSPVYGDAYWGWTVEGDDGVDSAIAAAQEDLYRFTVGSGGAFQVDIDNLPGDITTYEYVIAQNEGNTDEAKYTIAYYYTSADSIDSASASNTTRLYVNQDDDYEGFDRVFSVTLNVSNIKNELSLVKTDSETGAALQNVAFSLYADDDGDGLPDSETPLSTVTTDENGTLQVWSDTDRQVLVRGSYVLVEDTPEGYVDETDPIQIVVDDEGVHVNAGTDTDNVTVETGIGSLVYSMRGFAAGDDVDATLHDVVAQAQTASTYEGESTEWTDDSSANATHYQYDDTAQDLSYRVTEGVEDNGTETYTAQAGWSRLSVAQCLNHASEENELIKKDLGDQSLNALFTGDVTIHVTNSEIPTTGALRVDKTVEGFGAPSDAEFSYTLNLSDGAASLAGEYMITKYDATGQLGDSATISDGGTFTLQNGQYVVIEGLPVGTGYTVNEAFKDYYTASVSPETGDENLEDGLYSTGTIEDAVAQVSYINTFTGGTVDYSASIDLDVEKTLTGRDMAAGEFKVVVDPADAASAALLGLADENTDKVIDVPAATDGAAASVDILEGLDAITFTAGDAGTYTYAVYEQQPDQNPSNGVTYDTSLYTLRIVVAVDDDGVVTVTTNVYNEGEEDGEPLRTATTTPGGSPAEILVAAFQNAYKATGSLGGDGSASIKATKVLENDTLEAGDFTFHIAAVKNDDTERVDATATNDADGTVTFPAISYNSESLAADVNAGYALAGTDADGNATYTYTYRVYEDAGNFEGSGISTEQGSYTARVVVTDDGDGSLEVAVTYVDAPADGITFTNVYGADATASLDVAGIKNYVTNGLTGAPDITGAYTFTLTGVDKDDPDASAPLPDGATGSVTVKNQENGAVDFGTITYGIEDLNGAGSRTFVYTVTEEGNVEGVTNDSAAASGKSFEVTLTDNGDGTISVDAEAMAAAGEQFAFTNVYSADPTDPTNPTIDGGLTIDKTLTGRSMNEGEFSFTMEAVDDYGDAVSPTSITATNTVNEDGAGSVSFADGFTFSEEGEYHFTISEDNGGLGGVSYDDAVYTATAEVKDNGKGQLTVKWTVEDSDGNAADDIMFQNTYTAAAATANFSVFKQLEGATLTDGQFTFELTGSDGAPLPESTTATNAENGWVNFGSISFESVGEYDYTITEVNDGQDGVTYDEDNTRTVHVSVTDDGEGSLVATVTYGADGQVFVNTYSGTTPGDGGDGEDGGITGDDGNDTPLISTGDSSLTYIVIALIVGAACVVAGTALKKRK